MDYSPKMTRREVTFPFSSADDLLRIGSEHGLAVRQIALANEASWKHESEVLAPTWPRSGKPWKSVWTAV
jgi:hypothetical protein